MQDSSGKRVLKTPSSLTMEKEHTSVVTVHELLFHSIRHTKLPWIVVKNTLLSSHLGLMLHPQNTTLSVKTWAWNALHRSMGDEECQGASSAEEAWPSLDIRNLWARVARPSYHTSTKFNCLHVTLLSDYSPIFREATTQTCQNPTISHNLNPLPIKSPLIFQQLPTFFFFPYRGRIQYLQHLEEH